MFANLRKECFLHFLGMSDISLIVSEIGGNAKLYVYIGDCTSAMTSREYPTTELLQFCETFFKGKYQICGVSKEKVQVALKAQPITNPEPLTVEKFTAAGWSCKFNADTNKYACSIDTPRLILYVGIGKDYTHFFIISKFNLKKGERVEMFIPQKIDIEIYRILTVGEFNSLLEISGFVKFKI